MQKLQKIIRRLFESKMEIHVVFIVFFLLSFFLPPLINNLPLDKILHVVIYAFFLLICIYTGRWCSRKWLLKNKFSMFFFYMPASLIILAFASVVGLKTLTQNNVLSIIITGLFFVLLFFFLGLFLSVTRNTVLRQINEAKILQQQKEIELEILRSQLSPHFLFNTLNNIYGISLLHHEKVPVLLLKLSDLLRYSVYDAKELFVPLKNELAYIKNYIDFEKIRIGDKLELEISYEDVDPSVKIAPLLLIVFIENAFKHSKNTIDQKIYIRIVIKTLANAVLFAIKNSCSTNKKEESIVKKDSGFGLENVIKRLELLYRNEYDLKAEEKDGFYNVMLQLKSR